jgi:hypothetical protein
MLPHCYRPTPQCGHDNHAAGCHPDVLLDCLDDLVTVPWPLSDEMGDEQAKVAMSEAMAEAWSAATARESSDPRPVVLALSMRS